jgi:hypothetical protein
MQGCRHSAKNALDRIRKGYAPCILMQEQPHHFSIPIMANPSKQISSMAPATLVFRSAGSVLSAHVFPAFSQNLYSWPFEDFQPSPCQMTPHQLHHQLLRDGLEMAAKHARSAERDATNSARRVEGARG